jgi:3-isopropylmalate dehydrogenase
MAACKWADAILFGSVGGPKWNHLPNSQRPEAGALLPLRKEFSLFCNFRPAKIYQGLGSLSPLRADIAMRGFDMLCVRELTGGIYFGKQGSYESAEKLFDGTTKGKVYFDTESYSEAEIKRILRRGFEFAHIRNKKLTVVDKANVLITSRMWRQLAKEMSEEFKDVALDFLYVDNASMQLVARPSSFDVIVTSNMFGDILSDLAGQITGSVGMLPSASLGNPGMPGMFEPIHGSAPDIAGQHKANPIASILSVEMMLRLHLGEKDAAEAITQAVRKTLAEGARTPDIAVHGDEEDKAKITLVNTDEMTDRIIANLE